MKATDLPQRPSLLALFRPRLFVLTAAFICACAVTVGLLGWQLTMVAGKQNVSSLIQEIEFLVSNQVSEFLINSSQTLSRITNVQAEMFRTNKWSFSTPDRTRQTFNMMLTELKSSKQYTTSMYIMTYPEGLMFGYNYNVDLNGNLKLQWWNQSEMTLYTFECDPTGTPTRLLVSNTDAGNGTIANPGNNNTLGNTVGGSVGVDLNYTKDSFGFTDVYVWANSNIFKSSYYFVTNQVTGEKVTFGNDWTLSFLSNKIRQIISIVSFPIFAAVIECNTGYILGTSSFAPLLLDDQLLTLPQVNDVYLQDFYAVVSSKFGPVQNLSQSLNNAAQFIHVNFPGTENWFVDRKMGTSNWKVGVNSCTITGKQLLFVIYMNVDSVEEQLNKLSVITGDIMAGIITVFVLIGIGFALVISRQLLAVVTQIKLAQDLKLDDMLNEEHERYSFIFELAELQKAFNGMMFVFKDFLKRNHQMTRRVGPGNSEAVKPSDNINFGSKPTNNSSN